MQSIAQAGVATLLLLATVATPLPATAKGAALTRPAVLFTSIVAGPTSGGLDNLGAPISIFGKGFGSSRGASTVTISGVEVARYVIWGENNANNAMLDMIVVQPGASVSAGLSWLLLAAMCQTMMSRSRPAAVRSFRRSRRQRQRRLFASATLRHHSACRRRCDETRRCAARARRRD